MEKKIEDLGLDTTAFLPKTLDLRLPTHNGKLVFFLSLKLLLLEGVEKEGLNGIFMSSHR